MKPLTRDVTLTLLVKLVLLFALWFICIKGVDKPEKDTRQWLFGGNHQELTASSLR